MVIFFSLSAKGKKNRLVSNSLAVRLRNYALLVGFLLSSVLSTNENDLQFSITFAQFLVGMCTGRQASALFILLDVIFVFFLFLFQSIVDFLRGMRYICLLIIK